MMKLCYLIIFVTFLFSCSDSTDALEKKSVLDIKEVGILASTEYTIGKVLYLEDDTEWYKIGDRKIIIRCEAKVKAGVDLSKIDKDDIVVTGDQLTIKVPEVKVVSFNIDPLKMTTEAEDINGMRAVFSQEEKRKILELGEESIKEKIRELKILDDGKKNVENFLTAFYKGLGFKEIDVIFDNSNYDF